MKKGDIVLISFPFTDLSGSKNRPALVLISRESDVVVSFITSNIIHSELYDIIISPSLKNGLKKTSTIKISKLATLNKTLILGKIGRISTNEILKVNESLRVLFQISS